MLLIVDTIQSRELGMTLKSHKNRLMLALVTVGVSVGILVSGAVAQKRSHPARKPAANLRQSMDMAAVAEARRALDDHLLDYPRARLRSVRLVQSGTLFKAFCGEINVTNRMGGYNGWHAFLLPLGDSSIASLYDKPTIQGQPTQMGGLLKKYADLSAGEDTAGNLIKTDCGTDAVRIDENDYSTALSSSRSQ